MDNFAFTRRSFRGYGTISRLIIAGFFVSALCLGIAAQDTPLRIIEQPLPELPQNHSTQTVQGTVVLRIQFLNFGEIGEINRVKELPGGITEKAIAAAKRIKFEPEKKDGKPVTVVKEIQYFYTWNGGWQIPSSAPNTAPPAPAEAGKAEAVIAKAIQTLGGNAYLQIKTQIGRGKFSVIKEGAVVSFQMFVDVLVFPDKERTEFKENGVKTVQTNTGDTGWVFDGAQELIKVQTAGQVANFKQGIRTSLDNLLRGAWKGNADLTYIGKRRSTLGKRNDVVKVTYKDGFSVEFEFAADDGLPQKATYKTVKGDGEEVTEEDRYAQFIDIAGVKSPFVIDRWTNGKPSSRLNYDSLDYNKQVPDSIFTKPANPKDMKKDLKW